MGISSGRLPWSTPEYKHTFATLCLVVLSCWGAALKSIDPITVLVALASTAAALATAGIEEKDCLNKFGDEYRSYMKRTKMFIPFVL